MTKKRIRLRTLFIGLAFTGLFFLLSFRLLWLQTVDAPWLMGQAEAMWQRNEVLQPKRGAIYDRNGELLAKTAKAYTVIAKLKPWDSNDKSIVTDSLGTGQKLSSILSMPADQIAKLIDDGKKANRTQVELRPGGWKIDEDKAQKVMNLKIPGIFLSEDQKRYYPNDAFAPYVIGYLNLDGKAVMGTEKEYNDVLSGKPGYYKALKDRAGFSLPDGVESFKPAQDGNDVYLTIDSQIQNYVEDALNTYSNKYKANGMTVIVADPNTGDILAMGNRPHFNPNDYRSITRWSNFAVSSTFEPGSTFKIVTLSAAIQEGLYHNNETYMSGAYTKVPGAPIHDYNRTGWGRISFLRGVQESSNVLFTILGYERLGKDKFYEYLDKFGFGQKTGIELPGEVAAQLKDKNSLYPRDFASMPWGQGVVVTAIQQVAAVCAVANGGELLKPHIVKEIRDAKTGQIIQEKGKEVVHRVISEDTSKQVRDILETVVSSGTGKPDYIAGYHVAGKTGTAQVVGDDGKYKENKYIFSFIGFAPKDHPKLVVYVVVDQPELDDPNAGGRDVVAPIFKQVMQNSLQYLKISPDSTQQAQQPAQAQQDPVKPMPDLSGKTVAEAQKALNKYKLTAVAVGNGSKVIKQYPESDKPIVPDKPVYLITSNQVEKSPLPDLTGLTLREVMEYAAIVGIKVDPIGDGFVVSQSIPPGTVVTKGQVLKVNLQPNVTQDQTNKSGTDKSDSG
jgi:penicillin-binding protein 2B